ncbi:MAG: hypothetical protein JRH18_18215 [Deltaproteobacteria bacterium]|nr:hypothetical protein [Deltaproteobacteria bacterium]MBW1961878.1 hypothetical protein [Deltaproteobacteria bacterium]MBW1994048.1 hypothetical protein [Deltaproteobacteria bacterium]MBW2153592.1 hypothetical protein [Deltaproteobacteria bacterium]
MKITNKEVAKKLIDYLHHEITLTELVDWAEDVMMDADFEDEHLDTLKDIVGRLGLADVRAFDLSWENCKAYLERLGYRIKIEVTEKETTA